MDSDRFDDLSRTLATRRSRRAVLGTIGATLAGLVAGQAASAAPKKAKPSKCYGGGSHCTNGKQCCSGICSNRQCVAEVEPECVTAADCPGTELACQVAVCVEGVCGSEPAAATTSCAAGVCDGNGGCVECLSGSDCASGICNDAACVTSCEGDPAFGTPCTVGVGACLRDGVLVCDTDGISLICNAVPGPAGQEICNGIDDDCDGQVDQGVICPPVANGASECVDGACTVVSCDDGYDHCTSDPTDGCETSIMDDAWNCGGCGVVCPLAGTFIADQICTSGVCVCINDGDCPSGEQCNEGSSLIPGYCS